MSHIFIINAHHYYPFSKGELNASLVEKMVSFFSKQGDEIRITTMKDEIDVDAQIANHQWADLVILQMPVNWMAMPWPFKKYMDEVYSAGMMGGLCNNDGRNSSEPKKNYGRGGTLSGKKYMLSLTFNAPLEAFNNANDFFEGKGVDDLMMPMHMNFKFFDMQSIPTFACFDVMKNPDIENDFIRFHKHLQTHFA